MRTVLCVLKTGRWTGGYHPVRYEPRHVCWLRDQALKYSPEGTRFVCLTDADVQGVETVPLTMNWPGWWSKIEMFRHDLGPVLYMDLDTVIVGPLDEMLAHPHEFSALQSLTQPKPRLLNSGLMAWTGARLDLYEPFAADAERWMRECRTGSCWGDQGFLQRHLGDRWQAFQSLFPGAVTSFKAGLKRKDPKPGNRIVCFHGVPKPWEVKNRWVPCLN